MSIENFHQTNSSFTVLTSKFIIPTLGRFSVAPMLNWTNRHCRFFLRQLSKYALLYTEMITTNAILYSGKDHLIYNESEHPLALQLAGNDPNALARCAKIAQKRDYDEINFNVGCPSNRVYKGQFGAYLLTQKNQVAECVAAMREAVVIPITVKTRIGIDKQDNYEFLHDFINTVATRGGCKTFIIHARKALSNNLSPKKNREIPPLDYDRVFQLKRDFPALQLILNGGIKTFDDMHKHLKKLDGVMIGREIYQNPSILLRVDSEIFGYDDPLPNIISAINVMIPYINKELSKGTMLHHMVHPMLRLFQGKPGARYWRHYLSEYAYRHNADIDVLLKALSFIQNP